MKLDGEIGRRVCEGGRYSASELTAEVISRGQAVSELGHRDYALEVARLTQRLSWVRQDTTPQWSLKL